MPEPIDFVRPVVTCIRKTQDVDEKYKKSSVRLYCEHAESRWNLQVRGPLQLANGRDGRDFTVATAHCSADDLRALRDTIDVFLAELANPTSCPECASPSPERHPAVQHGGEVQVCDHEFHGERHGS